MKKILPLILLCSAADAATLDVKASQSEGWGWRSAPRVSDPSISFQNMEVSYVQMISRDSTHDCDADPLCDSSPSHPPFPFPEPDPNPFPDPDPDWPDDSDEEPPSPPPPPPPPQCPVNISFDRDVVWTPNRPDVYFTGGSGGSGGDDSSYDDSSNDSSYYSYSVDPVDSLEIIPYPSASTLNTFDALGINEGVLQTSSENCGNKVRLCERHASIAMNNCMAGKLNALADEAGRCPDGNYSVNFGGNLSVKGKKLGAGNVNVTIEGVSRSCANKIKIRESSIPFSCQAAYDKELTRYGC